MRLALQFLGREMRNGVHLTGVRFTAFGTERRQVPNFSLASHVNLIRCRDPFAPRSELITESLTVAYEFGSLNGYGRFAERPSEIGLLHSFACIIERYAPLRNATCFCFGPFSILIAQPIDTVLPIKNSVILFWLPCAQLRPQTVRQIFQWDGYRRRDPICIN